MVESDQFLFFIITIIIIIIIFIITIIIITITIIIIFPSAALPTNKALQRYKKNKSIKMYRHSHLKERHENVLNCQEWDRV